MKKYQKPEITVLSFVSMEAVSADGLNEWLSKQPNFQDDTGLANAIETYDVSSVGL